MARGLCSMHYQEARATKPFAKNLNLHRPPRAIQHEDLHIRVPKGTRRRVKRIIKGRGITMGEHVRQVLIRSLNRYEVKNRVLCSECNHIPCKCGEVKRYLSPKNL